jgi:hypothetical protein
MVPGCGLRGPQATATFHLTGGAVAARPLRCAGGAPCAHLTLQPARAAAGTRVTLTGWAPLTPVIGGPVGYQLVLSPGTAPLAAVSQGLSGALSATFVVPYTVGANHVVAAGPHTLSLQYTFAAGAGRPARAVSVASASLTVEPAPTWSSLGDFHPLWIEASQPISGAVVRAASVASGPVAVCAPGGGIRWTADGGKTWAEVPTASVVAVAARTQYVFQPGPGGQAPVPACASVLADARHPGSFYATFDLVAPPCDCAPPDIAAGYVTTDGGAQWRAVPPPPGFTAGDFGGFQVRGDAVQALYASARLPRGGQAAPMGVMQTTDGGTIWTPAALGCPGSGPCVRLGARASNINACMAEIGRSLLGSSDGGATWRALRTINECGPGAAQVAAIRPSALLILGGGLPGPGGPSTSVPLQLSRDGGATWSVVALPPLPGAAAQGGGSPVPITLLPDGAIAAVQGAAVELLAPGAAAWCPAAEVSPPAGAGGPAVAGGLYWWTWVAPRTGGSVRVAPGGVPVSALRCAG